MRDATPIREGMTVRTPDGEKLGKVASVIGDEFIIEKGLLFKHDYRARCDRIMEVRGDEIIYQPIGADERAAGGVESAAAVTAGAAPAQAATPQAATPRDEIRVPLAEEEVDVQKRATQRAGARITKDVVTEEKQVTVPVTREKISVERVAVEPGTPAKASFQQDEVTIPVVEEEVIVTKRPVVREEVRVRKQEVQEQRVASTDVRREEARVEELPNTEEAATTSTPGTDTVGGMRAPGRDDDKMK
jgi:uncharacterized protein (TIGR02271 family)